MNADERGYPAGTMKERIFVFQHTIEKNLYLLKTPEGEVVPPVPRNDFPEGGKGRVFERRGVEYCSLHKYLH